MDCIIPFYNEGKRIVTVVAVVKKVSSISQIICVDDGSTDGASDILQNKFPEIILVKLPKNVGKSGAVFAGLEHVKTKNLILLDGDLLDLKSEEIEKACQLFFHNTSLDMLILQAHGEWKYSYPDTLFRSYIVQSGNRIMKRRDLLEVEKCHPKGYQLEVAINQYMTDTHKEVGWFPLSALNLHKVRKTSFVSGWIRNIQMEREIASYLGFYKQMKQILFFCRRKYSY